MSDKRVTVWVQKFADRATLQLQWIDPVTNQRKTRSARTGDPDEAEQARADLEYELAHGTYQEASLMSWEKFRQIFWEEQAVHKRKATQDKYRGTFDLFERLCHPRQLRSITERTLSAFVAAMRRAKIRGGKVGMDFTTIKVRLAYFHSALRWAVEQKLIPACPRFPKIKVPKKKPQPVPTEAFEKLLDKAQDPQMRTFLLCGWLAGLRRTEAFNLEWEETKEAPYLDLARNRIILPAEMVKAVEDQWVPLDPVLREALLSLPRHGKKVFHITGKQGQVLSLVRVNEAIADLARKAGVKLTMRSLRRGFGCRYAGKVPAQVLQKLMRHSNIAITMDYYANVDDAVMEAVLGPQRNGSRNTRQVEDVSEARDEDATSNPSIGSDE